MELSKLLATDSDINVKLLINGVRNPRTHALLSPDKSASFDLHSPIEGTLHTGDCSSWRRKAIETAGGLAHFRVVLLGYVEVPSAMTVRARKAAAASRSSMHGGGEDVLLYPVSLIAEGVGKLWKKTPAPKIDDGNRTYLLFPPVEASVSQSGEFSICVPPTSQVVKPPSILTESGSISYELYAVSTSLQIRSPPHKLKVDCRSPLAPESIIPVSVSKIAELGPANPKEAASAAAPLQLTLDVSSPQISFDVGAHTKGLMEPIATLPFTLNVTAAASQKPALNSASPAPVLLDVTYAVHHRVHFGSNPAYERVFKSNNLRTALRVASDMQPVSLPLTAEILRFEITALTVASGPISVVVAAGERSDSTAQAVFVSREQAAASGNVVASSEWYLVVKCTAVHDTAKPAWGVLHKSVTATLEAPLAVSLTRAATINSLLPQYLEQ